MALEFPHYEEIHMVDSSEVALKSNGVRTVQLSRTGTRRRSLGSGPKRGKARRHLGQIAGKYCVC